MTIKGAQQEGYLITEGEARNLEKLVLAQYREAEILIEKKLEKLYSKFGNLAPEDRYNWLIQYDRNTKLKKEIAAAYTKHDLAAYKTTVESGRLAIGNNYYRQFYQLNFQEPLSFALLPENLIDYAVTGQVEKWKALTAANKARFGDPAQWPPSATLLDVFRKNRTDALQQIQRDINAGIIAGDSYAQTARRVKKTIGFVNPEGATGQMAKSMRIVRTEANRLMNAGSHASALTANDQLGGGLMKYWDATFDTRTRPAHASADGQTQPIEKPYLVGGELLMYPGDAAGSAWNVINDRCQSTETIGDWKPEARRGTDPETGENSVFNYKNFEKWSENNGLTVNKYGQLYRSK